MGVLASGLGRRSSSHYSPTGSPNSPSLLAKRQFAFPILAVLAVAALGLWLLLPGGALRAQDDAIEYPENGEGVVATFTADDPEGATSITWAIAGATDAPALPNDIPRTDNEDSALFTIDDEDGTLEFADSPDYENAGDQGTNNTYQVVVAATDAATNGQTGFHKVTVKVTDVDEAGKVTWTVDPDGNGVQSVTQFQVGAALSATATDGDIAGAEKAVTNAIWRWYRSADDTSTGTLIEGTDAQDNTYTTTLDDAGMYLRVVAHYVVAGNVDQESASLTSSYPVLATRVGTNELEFDPDEVELSVAEGDEDRNVGARVTATGNHGAVYYTLGGTDATKFDIDEKTGQITTGVDLDFEAAAGDGSDNCTVTNACVVEVTARDASGDSTTADSATNPSAAVTIKITDVDEKPTFPATAVTAVTRDENDTALTDDDPPTPVTYTAMDPETRNIVYTLMGSDAAKFQLSDAQVLSFRAKPDYETPTDRNRDNVYEVTVRASDGTMHADRVVKVTVIGVDEVPVVTGRDSVDYRENGEGVVATFTAKDPEGATSITWAIAGATDAPALPNDIPRTDNEDSALFTIDDEDGTLEFADSPDYENAGDQGTNNTYQVVVAATDAATNGQTGFHKVTVKVTDVDEAGKVTWTVDPDGNGVQSVTQFQVGAALSATATDGDIAGDTKTVVGPGATNITWRWYRGGTLIADQTGQTYSVTLADVGQRIRATVTYQVGTSTTQESASLTSSYPVLATRVGTNELEFDPDEVELSVAEGDEDRNVGARVTATGNHGAVYYTLGGTDATKFDIDEKTGQITTGVDLDFEAAAGDGSDNCTVTNACVVEVTARDASGDSTTADSATNPSAAVTIKITDVDEKPTFDSGAETVTVDEGTEIVRGDSTGEGTFNDSDAANLYVATDEDGLNVNLSLMGPDAADFSLSSTGVLFFVQKPDYENPADANRDNLYEVTVRASDGTMHADREIRVTVENVNEAPEIIQGGLAISGQSRVDYSEDSTTTTVGTYTARGENAAGARWTLEGADRGDFSLSTTSGASVMLRFRSSPDYESPADADTNNVYMVTLKATEGTNTDTHNVMVRVTDVVEDVPVIGDDTLLGRYAGDDGILQRGEVISAIDDYLDAGVGAPSRAEVIELIDLYLDS